MGKEKFVNIFTTELRKDYYIGRDKHVSRLLGGMSRLVEGGAKLEDSTEIGKYEHRAVPFFSWFLIAAAKKANSWIDKFL